VRTEESLEQMLALFDGNPDPVVADAENHLEASTLRPLFRPRYLDEPIGLRGIAILDGVRQIILDAQLDYRCSQFDFGHSGKNADVDIGRVGSFPHLTHCFGYRPRQHDVPVPARIVEIGARQNEDVVDGVLHLPGIPQDDVDQLRALLRRHVRNLTEHTTRAEQGGEAVLDLVRDHPIEGAQPLLTLGDVLVGEEEEVRHRRLLDDGHRAVEARSARHQLALLARLVDLVHRPRKEREEDPAEEFVLLQDLVGIEALLVTELAELHRLGDDGHVDSHFGGRILDIVRDALQQERDVVE